MAPSLACATCKNDTLGHLWPPFDQPSAENDNICIAGLSRHTIQFELDGN
jgi:hypothetical protein